jgi:hypothetical protein
MAIILLELGIQLACKGSADTRIEKRIIISAETYELLNTCGFFLGLGGRKLGESQITYKFFEC